MGDGLQEGPEERLGEGPAVSLPATAPCLRADVLALDAMDEDGLQGAAEKVGVAVLAGHHGVRRHIALLQGLERLGQLLFDLHDDVSHREMLATSCLFWRPVAQAGTGQEGSKHLRGTHDSPIERTARSSLTYWL